MDRAAGSTGPEITQPKTSRLLRVALTGGIATGKSYCLRAFASLGVPVIDADVLAREAVRPGSPGLHAVVTRFGPDVMGADGELNRAALGRIVFDDAAARRELEAIIHPLVYQRIQTWFEGLRATASVAIADIPLLFETRREHDFDKVIVAASGPEQALRRLMARDGLPERDARIRIAAQWPIERKASQADYVIDTSKSEADTERQVREVLAVLKN